MRLGFRKNGECGVEGGAHRSIGTAASALSRTGAPGMCASSPGAVLPPPSVARCRVEKSLLWEITGSLAAAGNDSRVGKQFLFSKPKIVVKQTVFNRAHTKDPRPTSSIQR